MFLFLGERLNVEVGEKKVTHHFLATSPKYSRDWAKTSLSLICTAPELVDYCSHPADEATEAWSSNKWHSAPNCFG